MGSLRLNITMRGLTGLIISLAFYSYQCAKFQEGNCSYGCNPDGSCNVASGGQSASCSSPQSQFGGACIGENVNGCRDCREACGNGSNGGSSSGSSSSGSGTGGSSGGSKSDRNCRYECQSNGGCEVTYIGPPRNGQTSGSCFPASFGGSCSGTPRECQDCNRALSCSEGGSSSSGGNSRPSSGSSSSSTGSSLALIDVTFHDGNNL